MIAEVGRCGCCTDLVFQNGQLVVDPLADWQPVELFQERFRTQQQLNEASIVSDNVVSTSN